MRKAPYSQTDWDAVHSPEATDAELAQAKPFAEALPDVAEAVKRGRGRPRKADARVVVTIRLAPDTLERYQRLGPDWRARMAAALEE